MALINIKLNETAIVSEIVPGKPSGYPQMIEGMDNLALDSDISRTHSSFLKVLSRLEIHDTSILVIGFLIFLLLICLFAIRSRHKDISINLVFLLGAVLYLTSELFLPVQRYSYNDVQWLFPLVMIAMEMDVHKLMSSKLTFLLSISLLLSIGCFSWVPKFLLISIALMFLYVMLTLLMLLQQLTQHRSKLPVI